MEKSLLFSISIYVDLFVMKRILAILLCLFALSTSLTACSEVQNQSDTLTILMEGSPKHYESSFTGIFKHYYNNDSLQIEVDYLSDDPVIREGQLANIRAEIMAGKGPDIFILPTWDMNYQYDEDGQRLPRTEPLFIDLVDAMNNKIFLNLDDYVAESSHYNPDEHLEVIMNAGKTEDGQYVMPLLFTYELKLLYNNRLSIADCQFDDFSDLENCGNKNILSSARQLSYRWIPHLLTDCVDYNTDTIKISQEELSDILESVGNISNTGGTELLYNNDIGTSLYGALLDEDFLYSYNMYHEEVLPLVVPNVEEGITAKITAYCAINANTKHPQEAFELLELFFSSDVQVDGVLSMDEIGFALPSTPRDFGTTSGVKTGYTHFSESTYYNIWQSIRDMNSNITYASFVTEFDCKLCDTWNEADIRLYSGETPDYDMIAAELYSDWKMMIAE